MCLACYINCFSISTGDSVCLACYINCFPISTGDSMCLACYINCFPISTGDSVCLACYVANGHIMVYSLPSLKLLLDMDFLPLSDLRYYSEKLRRIL
ncbi:hypothetical protein DPMN_054388 [Dreissena polymorpha]|uniref:Uncharacterized protein n=1 Tax=Dreissena polymorpha TaxID=45954 RepID=A0A9D4CNT6_DREPO|nr:hypothetical protein DPMN_054388 [Dreissena polymorpha]